MSDTTTWTDPKGHDWTHDAQAKTWTRKTAKRMVVITLCETAPDPYRYQLAIENLSGITLDGSGFEILDAAAIMAHHTVH
jgi:hypothetical protein